MSSSESYLRAILEGLIDDLGALQIVRTTDEMGILLSVSVARSDMGKVIGREGSTAKAIRSLMNSHGFKMREKVSVKVLEPEN